MTRCAKVVPTLFAITVFAVPAFSQTAACRLCEMGLPTPTLVRTASGAPGPRYWQQRVDYVIHATLDTMAKVVTGTERITYANHSPDTLRYLWLRLEQNVYRGDSRDAWGKNHDAEIDPSAGMTLKMVRQPAIHATAKRRAQPAIDLAYVVNGTMLRVDLSRPLPPKSRQVLDLAWELPVVAAALIDDHYIYQVARWYPRLAVYDDVRGWNVDQHYRGVEFYLEYGRFDVSLTLPADMVVAATGILQNPSQVLTVAQRDRLAHARASDSTIVIRSRAEVAAAIARPSLAAGVRTWRFTADSVRDFTWAAARHFLWDAVRVNGGQTLAMTFYPPSVEPAWKEAAGYAKMTLEHYSTQWYPYPYPTASNVYGRVYGMEYPMIVFSRAATPQGLYILTDHEFGHNWFPMLVGSNETRSDWMDEHLNYFINRYNRPSRLFPSPETKNTLTVVKDPRWRVFGLTLLREQVTSPSRFDRVFREYIRRWAFKHPTPADFFRTMEDGLGEDLGWFWRGFFQEDNGTLDQAIDSVVVNTTKRGPTSSIYLRQVGSTPMIVVLELRMRDRSSQRIKLPVEVWLFNGDHYTATVPGDVVAVTVDPEGAYDLNRSNNRWPVGSDSLKP